MDVLHLTEEQEAIAGLPADAKVFLSGPAGSGKTTAGVARLEFLLNSGIPGNEVLVLTPQRSLLAPYKAAAIGPAIRPGGALATATIAGLARRMCGLFWPLAAETAGFGFPERPPTFLTLETAQYYMAYVLKPLLAAGYFASVTLQRSRLYSQILDNLNKSAFVGFPLHEIGARLQDAHSGEPSLRRAFEEVQESATQFRAFCLAHNLLDYSLQLETFLQYVWPHEIVRRYMFENWRHLIYDNMEEDVPRAHDFARAWLPALSSALMIADDGAGLRRFLGADPESAFELGASIATPRRFNGTFVMSRDIAALEARLGLVLRDGFGDERQHGALTTDTWPGQSFRLVEARFFPEMLKGIVDAVSGLISQEGMEPDDIVVVAPYLPDAVRFALTSRLESAGIPWRSLRPSRPLRDEPPVRTLLTLAALAHPHWGIHPPRPDVATALRLSIEGLDPIRAHLLTQIVYQTRDLRLTSYREIRAETRKRLGEDVGARYERLREWLAAGRQGSTAPLDYFLRRLFGEVLAQPGYGFHRNPDAIRIAASLVESIHKFRTALQPATVGLDRPDFDIGREYVAMLEDGVLGASYEPAWTGTGAAVLVAPAHAYVMLNRPVRAQVWMDIGSSGWHERIAQPLTHPYVLSRAWTRGRKWLDTDESAVAQDSLRRLVSSLLRRCRETVFVCVSEMGELGYEQRGLLLQSIQDVLTLSSQ